MIEDPDDIIKGYDPSNPVHNPAGYMRAIQEVDQDVRRETNEAMKRRLADKPGQFAKLGCMYWILIIALCLFVGYLFTL